jgi:hypothetical protein
VNFNPWAVVAAAASSFLLGGLWYSKALFGPAWGCAAGVSATEKHGHPARVFGINYQFADRKPALWLIDGGYHTVQFVLFGLVLGLWH